MHCVTQQNSQTPSKSKKRIRAIGHLWTTIKIATIKTMPQQSWWLFQTCTSHANQRPLPMTCIVMKTKEKSETDEPISISQTIQVVQEITVKIHEQSSLYPGWKFKKKCAAITSHLWIRLTNLRKYAFFQSHFLENMKHEKIWSPLQLTIFPTCPEQDLRHERRL